VANNNPYSSNSVNTEPSEHKSNMPSELELARDIAAFANTDGGRISIGYVPTRQALLNQKLIGLSDNQVRDVEERIMKALSLLNPRPDVKIEDYDLLPELPPNVRLFIADEDILFDALDKNARKVIFVDVLKSPTPVLLEDARYYVRRGNRTTLAEEELIEALSQSVPSIEPNILNSLQVEERGAEKPEKIVIPEVDRVIGDVAGGDIYKAGLGDIHKTLEENPYVDLLNILSESIKRSREELTTQRNERLHQARISFIVALVFLILAMLLVFTGVILIFTVNLQAGVVTSVSSIVSGIVSGLVFNFNKQANDRMDEYARELIILEKSYTAMQYIFLMTDVKSKDEAIRDLAKSISMTKPGQ
jgi:Putative DNA-binding domain